MVVRTPPNARSAVIVILVFSSALATVHTSSPNGSTDDLGEWSHTRHIERIERSGRDAFKRAIAIFDARLARRPDVRVAVEKCRLVAHFVDADGFSPIDAVAEDEQCTEALREPPYGDEPAALVYVFERTWEERAIAEGNRLIEQSSGWTRELRARVHAHMSFLMEIHGDVEKAGSHAIMAAGLDPATPVLLKAAQHLEQRGAKRRAHALLVSAPASVLDVVGVDEAAALLVRLGDAPSALRLVQERGGADGEANLFSLAGAMVASGDTTAARALFTTALSRTDLPPTVSDLRAYFAFERDHGSDEQVRSAYGRLRELGYAADPFGRYRLDLIVRDPAAPWALTDIAGLLALLGTLGVFALLPAAIVAPVHYRGLVRRLHGTLPPSPPFPWGLGHGWCAVGGVLIMGTVGSYVFAYPEFEALFPVAPYGAAMSDDRTLGHAMIVGSAALAVLCAWMLRGVEVSRLMGGQWPLRHSLRLATVLYVVLSVTATLWSSFVLTPAALGSGTTRALQGIHTEYGWPALFLIAVIVVPVAEEILFRGVLLNGLSRHVSFWTAAVAQALVFALLHEEVARMPLLMLMGLMAAWAYRRTQGLAAPVALHAFNNALACYAIISATQTLDRIPT
jgi:membrane protease YdiL (CAAX protease family)